MMDGPRPASGRRPRPQAGRPEPRRAFRCLLVPPRLRGARASTAAAVRFAPDLHQPRPGGWRTEGHLALDYARSRRGHRERLHNASLERSLRRGRQTEDYAARRPTDSAAEGGKRQSRRPKFYYTGYYRPSASIQNAFHLTHLDERAECPRRDSNPRYRLDRPASWASRRRGP